MNLQLKIDILSFWHSGTGKTSGTHVDSLTARNHEGLPYLGGRHTKGLIRDAIQKAQEWGLLGKQIEKLNLTNATFTDWLFGTHSNAEIDESRFTTTPGILSISNAQLTDLEVNALNENKELKSDLFKHLFSTAIDHQTGTAKDHSLRGVEVVIPMTLYAEIELNTSQQEALIIQECLVTALSFIDHVGGMRNRGFGRAQLTLEENEQGVAA